MIFNLNYGINQAKANFDQSEVCKYYNSSFLIKIIVLNYEFAPNKLIF